MDELVVSLGFESETEFHTLISQVDISTPMKMAAFKDWQHTDGTKAGLLKLSNK